MRRLRGDGLGIVFVTHFLDQVYAVTDRLTVLRNGELVGEYATSALSRMALVSKMLGREVTTEPSAPEATMTPSGRAAVPPLFSARGLGRRGAVHPLDLELHSGEVTGLAGLLGAGRTETARLLFGIDQSDAGQMTVRGRVVRLRAPRDAVRLGFAFCSEDRKVEGIFPNLSVRENLIFALQAKHGAWRVLSRVEQARLCEHYITALRIKTPGPDAPIRNLSGGNQQKVLLARWLATQPALIILDEPTRGIDIGAKSEIEQIIAKLRADGLAVLFISSEIEEVVHNCTRVVVLRERRKVGEFIGGSITAGRLMSAMAGGHGEPAKPGPQ
jgi:simple sugar transport system ATP-binding protein